MSFCIRYQNKDIFNNPYSIIVPHRNQTPSKQDTSNFSFPLTLVDLKRES